LIQKFFPKRKKNQLNVYFSYVLEIKTHEIKHDSSDTQWNDYSHARFHLAAKKQIKTR